jgi:hypothetical protein
MVGYGKKRQTVTKKLRKVILTIAVVLFPETGYN